MTDNDPARAAAAAVVGDLLADSRPAAQFNIAERYAAVDDPAIYQQAADLLKPWPVRRREQLANTPAGRREAAAAAGQPAQKQTRAEFLKGLDADRFEALRMSVEREEQRRLQAEWAGMSSEEHAAQDAENAYALAEAEQEEQYASSYDSSYLDFEGVDKEGIE